LGSNTILIRQLSEDSTFNKCNIYWDYRIQAYI